MELTGLQKSYQHNEEATMNTLRYYFTAIGFLLMLNYSANSQADSRIAILEFELNDITSLPYTAEELIRTASFKPLLAEALTNKEGYQVLDISSEQQKTSNAGFGYLFRFHDIAASLAKQVDADWVIVGQHSKPSFLYSYLIVNVVNVRTGRMQARIDVELKGNHQKVTQRSVNKLSREIDKVITYYEKRE